MYVVYAGDKNYFSHIGISLASLVRYDKPDMVYLLTDYLNISYTKELSDYTHKIGINFKIIEADLSSYRLKISKKIPLAAYYRLLLPDLLPDIEKVIYLDGDTVIINSLLPLWNVNLGKNYIAAVEDIGIKKSVKINLFGSDNLYFNSGILLIDLRAFRCNNLTAQMLEFAMRHKDKITYHDQCVLNYFTQSKWFNLPARYNTMACHILDSEKYCKEIENSVIIHYNSYFGKPWDYYCTHPMKNLYLEIKNQTPWKDQKLTKNDRLSFYRRKIILLDILLVFLRKMVNKIDR
jgi:lipopolysaccharide biosynthesis glycosyltransferase